MLPGSSPYAAAVVDSDGHMLAVSPGLAVGEPRLGPVVSLLSRVLHALGSGAGLGPMHVALFHSSDACLAMTTDDSASIVVAAVVPANLDPLRLRNALFRTRGRVADTLRSAGRLTSADTLSLLGLPTTTRTHLSRVLRYLLRQCGCPPASLRADSTRSRQTHLLANLCRARSLQRARPLLARLCDRLGLAAPRGILGTGSWGAAYLLRDGTVLKLTRDAGEASAAACVALAPRPALAPVRRVWSLSAQGVPAGVFAIARAFVELPGDSCAPLRDAALLGCELLAAARVRGWACAVQQTLVSRRIGHHERVWCTALRFAADVLRDLSLSGIGFGDFRIDNIGLHDERLCFFDLSLATAPQVPFGSAELDCSDYHIAARQDLWSPLLEPAPESQPDLA